MHLLILGANSDVAHAVARKFAKQDRAHVYLASRDMETLRQRANDIAARYGVQAEPLYFDALDYASHAQFYDRLTPKPDGVLVAFGYLGDQKRAQEDFQEAREIIDTNFLGAVSILEIIVKEFEKRGHGFIIGITSVAGERGRRSNYVYGAAKGAFTLYLSGLRNRLCQRNVKVTTVLLGFVRTKMTADLNLPDLLTASPEDVSSDIYYAYQKGSYKIYSRWFWRWIMIIIKIIPEGIFKKLSL
jgi:short-subunit dehydrogenase